MKNHHEISGIIANIVFAVVILAFIVIGLNKIGIYNLPENLERLLGTSDSASGNECDDNTYSEHEQLSYDISEFSVESGEITYQNAEKLIKGIDYNSNYAQELIINNYIDDEIHVEKISLKCNDGLYTAELLKDDDTVVRKIAENADSVEITTYDNGREAVVSLARGNFDISDECGFVLTAKDFINSAEKLQEADFSLFDSEYGAAISVTFNNTIDSLSIKESYVISLDFGVILSVESVIDGKTLYSMSTVMLDDVR